MARPTKPKNLLYDSEDICWDERQGVWTTKKRPRYLTVGASIMPTSGGGFEQAYNVQAGVDTETMLIVTSHVSQAPNDKKELEPALTNLKKLPQELGTLSDVLADNGYYSERNVTLCHENHIIPYVTVKHDKLHPWSWRGSINRDPCLMTPIP